MLELVVPQQQYLPAYVDALQRGWIPNVERGLAGAMDELTAIEVDPMAFLMSLDDRSPTDALVTLPDGSTAPRLPSFRRWMWDGDMVGTIGFRWVPGTTDLPPHCLGHIGYSVVPWKRRQGHATAALRTMLDEARAMKLPHVEITADPDNVPSQKVILAAGGQLHERFDKPAAYGGTPCLRFRIALA